MKNRLVSYADDYIFVAVAESLNRGLEVNASKTKTMIVQVTVVTPINNRRNCAEGV